MSEYQIFQLEAATVMLVGAVVPLGILVLIRRRALLAPVVAFSVLVGVLGVVGFVMGCLCSEGAVPRWAQVPVNYLKDTPIALIVCYTCLMQARRYRGARDRDRLRRHLERAPFVIGMAFFGGLVVELLVRPPVLESEARLPAVALVAESARYVALAVYAAPASVVFFGAAGKSFHELPGFSRRLQNFCGGVALATLSMLPLHTLAIRAARVFLMKEQIAPLVQHMNMQQVVLVGVATGSIGLGLLCHSTRGKRSEFAERFLGFVDLVGDLAEELAGAPVSEGKVGVPYASMHEAAEVEFLDLPAPDKRRIDDAFRVRAVLAHRGGGRICWQRLLRLSKLYEVEGGAPVLTEGLVEEPPGPGRDELRAGGEDLRAAVAFVLKTKDVRGNVDLTPFADWEQLVWVALVDAGLLPHVDERGEAFEKDFATCARVRDAYLLARHKVRNYKDGEPGRRPVHSRGALLRHEDAHDKGARP